MDKDLVIVFKIRFSHQITFVRNKNKEFCDIKVIYLIIFLAVILNQSDFDFLLTKGDPSNRHQPRDSILERFDPLSDRKSIAPQHLLRKIDSIAEVDSFSKSICSGDSAEGELIENSKSECLIKLDSSEKVEIEINSDSSVSESYVTASIGDSKSRKVRPKHIIHDICYSYLINFIFISKGDDEMSTEIIGSVSNDESKTIENGINPQIKMSNENKSYVSMN